MSLENSVIPRRYVYYLASAPSSAIAGDLWIDSDTNDSYFYNGSAFVAINKAVDLTRYDELIGIQGIDILRCLAHFTSTPSDYNFMYLDNFSTAGGYSATIDTSGVTDATFSTNLYTSGVVGTAASYTETSTALNSSAGPTGQNTQKGVGFKVYGSGYSIVSVTKNSVCTSTQVALSTTANRSNVVATATFSGNTATFSSPYALTANTEYWVLSTSESINHGKSSGTITYPDAGSTGSSSTYQFTSTSNDGVAYTTGQPSFNYDTIVLSIPATGALTKYVQSKTLTMDSTLVAYQLYTKNDPHGAGSTASYYISFDNGSTWSTEKQFNTKYNDGSGTNIKIKLKLYGANTDGNYATASNYALMVWY